jgi:hypothetical protein
MTAIQLPAAPVTFGFENRVHINVGRPAASAGDSRPANFVTFRVRHVQGHILGVKRVVMPFEQRCGIGRHKINLPAR